MWRRVGVPYFLAKTPLGTHNTQLFVYLLLSYEKRKTVLQKQLTQIYCFEDLLILNQEAIFINFCSLQKIFLKSFKTWLNIVQKINIKFSCLRVTFATRKKKVSSINNQIHECWFNENILLTNLIYGIKWTKERKHSPLQRVLFVLVQYYLGCWDGLYVLGWRMH